jgi:hypothetical protein
MIWDQAYTYDMVAHPRKQLANAAGSVTPAHGTVLKLIRKVEGVGHTLFADFDNPVTLSKHMSMKAMLFGCVI